MCWDAVATAHTKTPDQSEGLGFPLANQRQSDLERVRSEVSFDGGSSEGDSSVLAKVNGG